MPGNAAPLDCRRLWGFTAGHGGISSAEAGGNIRQKQIQGLGPARRSWTQEWPTARLSSPRKDASGVETGRPMEREWKRSSVGTGWPRVSQAAAGHTPPQQPPPVPSPPEIDPDAFGSDDEDGLRMLAALGAMTSLEPDYSSDSADEFSGEASVTIIEATAMPAPAGPFGVAQRRQHLLKPSLHPDGYSPLANEPAEPEFAVGTDESCATALMREEATVEIIYPDQAVQRSVGATPTRAEKPASLQERITAVAGRSAGSRFIRALSGK